MIRLFPSLAASLFVAAAALAQDPNTAKPGWSGMDWTPVPLVLLVLFALYLLRRRQKAVVDPTPPKATRLDPEH